jgi:hypothetical protein
MEPSSLTYEAREGAILVVAFLEGGGALAYDQLAVRNELSVVRLLPPQVVDLRTPPAAAPTTTHTTRELPHLSRTPPCERHAS